MRAITAARCARSVTKTCAPMNDDKSDHKYAHGSSRKRGPDLEALQAGRNRGHGTFQGKTLGH